LVRFQGPETEEVERGGQKEKGVEESERAREVDGGLKRPWCSTPFP